MKHLLLLCFLLLSSSFYYVYAQEKIKEDDESYIFEMSANASLYHSLSISVEKEYSYGKFKFGPRIELLNPFEPQTYSGEDTTYVMYSQVRLRLAQIEYVFNDKFRIGIAPFWLLGPLPRNGFYTTPSSIYTHIQIKNDLSLETTFTTTRNETVQISLRKKI